MTYQRAYPLLTATSKKQASLKKQFFIYAFMLKVQAVAQM